MTEEKQTIPTIEDVIEFIKEVFDKANPDTDVVYWSGPTMDKDTATRVAAEFNRPETASRVTGPLGWGWIHFSISQDCPQLGQDAAYGVYGVAHKVPTRPPVYTPVNWTRIIKRIIRDHEQVLERAKSERVSFVADSTRYPGLAPGHFDLPLFARHVPRLSVTAVDWTYDVIIIAGPKGSLDSV